jgi:8-oxo-dGTP diphosphatase
MLLKEKNGKWYWGKDGPFDSSSYARKFGAATYIRGHDYVNQLAQTADPLEGISEAEIRDAWQRLISDQAKRKIKQDDAEVLAAIFTAELINRNQVEQPNEKANNNLLTDTEPRVKNDFNKGEIATSCMSCTDSHWSTISGILNEAVRLSRQGYALDSEEIMSRISLAKEELNAWERFDASPDRLQNSDDFVKGVVRKMVVKGAQLRHSMQESGVGFGKGTLDALESAAAFAKQSFREFERELNASGICLIDNALRDEQVSSLVVEKAAPTYVQPNKPMYRIFEPEKAKEVDWNDSLVQAKWDGMRLVIVKSGENVDIYSDDHKLKNEQLHVQVDELKKIKHDFVADAEALMYQGDKPIHRVAIVGYINSNETDKSEAVRLHVFGLMYWDEWITEKPLDEVLDIMRELPSSAHIIVHDKGNLDGTIVRGKEGLVTAIEKVSNLPGSEGAMIKALSGNYRRENPQNKWWWKYKKEREVDVLVVARAPVKGSEKMFRYEIAVGPISREWAEAVGIGERGELLKTGAIAGEVTVTKQIEQLIAGSLLTSQLVFKTILLKQKVAKNEVDYTEESNTSDRCATCKSFVKVEGQDELAREPGECIKVLGKVSPRGWCKLYVKGWGPARSPETGQVRLSKGLWDDSLIQFQAKPRAGDAVEFEGKYYLRLGKSLNTDVDIPLGGILRVTVEEIDTYDVPDTDFKSFTAYLPRGKEPVPEKHVPDRPGVLARLARLELPKELQKADYASRKLNIARKLYDNDQLVEAVQVLDQEISEARARTDRGTKELWEEYLHIVSRAQGAIWRRATGEVNNLLRIADEIYREGERTTTKFERQDAVGVATVSSTGFTPTFGGRIYGTPRKKEEEPYEITKQDTEEPATIYDPLSPEYTMPDIDVVVIIERELAKRGIMVESADDIKLSVKAVVRNGGKVLVLKDSRSDFWDLPGGHVRDGEKLEDALAREVREETGLLIENPTTFKTEVMRLGGEEKPVVFYDVEASGDVKLSREHTDYKWITLNEVEGYNLGCFKAVLKEHARFNVKHQSELKFEKMMIELATRAGLIPKKVRVTREGKQFIQTVWVRPEGEQLTEPEKPPVVDFKQEKQIMNDVIAKLQSGRTVKYKELGDSFSSETISGLRDNADSHLGLYERFFDASTYNKARDIAYRLVSTGVRTRGTFTPTQLQELVNSSIDKLIYQEVRAWERQLGDHGIRHIWGDIDFQNRILTAMKESGIEISDVDRFLVNTVMVNHDIGYTVGEARTKVPSSTHHQEYSRQWFESEREFFGKYFSEDQLDEMEHYVLHHDQTNIDWEGQPLLSALSTADNLSLFHEEKLPSLFRYVDGSIDSLFEMQRALQRNDEAGIEKAKQELFTKIDKSELPKFSKSWLKQAAGEVSRFTPKFTIPMLIGHISNFDFARDTGLVVTVKEDTFEGQMADFFDMGQGQFAKFARIYGVEIANNDDIKFAKGGKQLLRLKIKRNPVTKELELIAELDDPLVAIELKAEYISLAGREGLIPKKVSVTRGGTTFEQTVYVRPEEEVKTKEHRTISPETRRKYSRFLQIEYNRLLGRPIGHQAAAVTKVLRELIEEQFETRKQVLGERYSLNGYDIISNWVEGMLPNVVGIRMMVAEMRGQKIDREMVRTQLESISGKPAEDKFVDSVMGIAGTFMVTLDPETHELTTKFTKEVLQKEHEFAVVRAKELFGDEITLYRGLYGSAAKKVKETIEKEGEVELDEFALSSYSQDPIAAFAFVHKKESPFLIKRKVKTDDIFLAWFSNPAFIGIMPEQKEVLISPEQTKFKIRKEDTWQL